MFVRQLVDGRWVDGGVFVEDDLLRAEPFPEVEIPLGEWWQPLPPEDAPPKP